MADMLQVEVGVLSHPGKKRANNEDFVTYFEPAAPQDLLASGRLYIVADGVGGASEGERASKFAAEQVKFLYYQNPKLPPGERLRWAMRQASQEIYRYAESDGSHRRMATTLVAAVILGDQLTVAHVGDSRAYLIRGGLAQQLTQDHTTVGEMVRSGLMSEAEAMRSKAKNRLTRSLGGDEDVSVEVVSGIPLQVGDRVLLCTDGLTRYADRAEIARLATEGKAEEAALRMVDYANEQGGADNVTVVLIAVSGVGTAPTIMAAEARGAAPAPIDLELLETQARAERRLPSRQARRKKAAPAPSLSSLPPWARAYAPFGVAIIAFFFVGMVIGIGVILKLLRPTPTENSAALFAAATATNAAKTATAQTAQTAQALLVTQNVAATQSKETEIALQATQTAFALTQAAQSQPTETPTPMQSSLSANNQTQFKCFGRINENTFVNNILQGQENTQEPLDVYNCKPGDKPTATGIGKCWFEKQLPVPWTIYQPAGRWIIIPDKSTQADCFAYSYTNSDGKDTFYGMWAEILNAPPPPTPTPNTAGGMSDQDEPPPGSIRPSEPPESSGPEEPPPESPEPPEPSEPPPKPTE